MYWDRYAVKFVSVAAVVLFSLLKNRNDVEKCSVEWWLYQNAFTPVAMCIILF